MDILNELENMAIIANDEAAHDDSISSEMVHKWQEPFNYSDTEAREHIERQRDDWSTLVSAVLWETVKDEQEALGFDRWAYSHWFQINKRQKSTLASHPVATASECEYLVRLEGPLGSPGTIAKVAGLSQLPIVLDGESLEDRGAARFCRIDSETKALLGDWMVREAPGFRPLFISQSRARKDLSATSKAPSLGCGSTLPQNRRQSEDSEPRPTQEEYPVWYFFYGTPADTATLERLFAHLVAPTTDLELHPAHIIGGRLETWGDGKYKALVDGDQDAVVEGWALLVASKEHEDALCYYETQAYEVVRCCIVLDGSETREVLGCTFRFVGQID